jgi:diguanylate cyclase (GGDEF)-like protein/PAS domain S-box-containing protein
MLGKRDKIAKGWSVELKLSATLVLVVLVTTLVLASVQYLFAVKHLEEHAQEEIRGHLQHMLNLVASLRIIEPDLVQALVRAQRQPRIQPKEGETTHIYGLNPEGRLIAPPLRAGLKLPPAEVLQRLAKRGLGELRLDIDGESALLVFDRQPDGKMVLVAQSLRKDYLGPTLDALFQSTVMVALGLALLVGLFSVLLARRVLSLPLKQLTDEAERVAGGDLSPPEPLAGRNDELGRLSLALNSMTKAAGRMVTQAQTEHVRFQRLFNDSKDGAFISGDDGHLVDVNSALYQMLGCDEKEQMLGKEGALEFITDPNERQLYLDTLFSQGYVQDFPATLSRIDGSKFEALLTVTVAGNQKARFGLIRDVTHMREAQRALAESEARYRRLVDNAPDIIYRWSFAKQGFDYISSAARDITGYGPEEITANSDLFWRVIHDQDREQVTKHWASLLHGQGPTVSQQEFRIVSAKGGTRWLRERSALIRDEVDQVVALEGIATDITERKLVEQELVKGQHMVEDTLQGLPVAVMVIDQERKVVHWNRAMEGLTGVPAAEMVGSKSYWQPFFLEPRPLLADLVLDGDYEHLDKRYGAISLKASQNVQDGLEGESFFPILGENGRHLYFLAAPIRDEQGQVVRAVETLVDLSDKHELEQELIKLSVTDSLTGLYNQRFFYASLAREVETAQRLGHPLSLLMADIDHFKLFNDSHGHLAGDQALTQFAGTVTNCVRGMDLACRYGGEEFAVLLPHAALSESLMVAERVREGVASRSFIIADNGGRGNPRHLTLSLGAATLGLGESLEDLVRRADTALYAAKNAGRNLVAASLFEGGLRVLPRGEISLPEPPVG